MKRKELTKIFMMISNWKTFWSLRFIHKYYSALRIYSYATGFLQEILRPIFVILVEIGHFQCLEVVDRGRETQLEVTENLNVTSQTSSMPRVNPPLLFAQSRLPWLSTWVHRSGSIRNRRSCFILGGVRRGGCKAERQYLLTCKVSGYCLLTLHGNKLLRKDKLR